MSIRESFLESIYAKHGAICVAHPQTPDSHLYRESNACTGINHAIAIVYGTNVSEGTYEIKGGFGKSGFRQMGDHEPEKNVAEKASRSLIGITAENEEPRLQKKRGKS